MTLTAEPREATGLPPVDPLATAVADVDGWPETQPEPATDGAEKTK